MYATVEWLEKDQIRRARWRSEAGLAAPLAVDVVDAANSVAVLWQQMRAGQCLLWRGDWPRARQLMQALSRLAERDFVVQTASTAAAQFSRHRIVQGQRAAVLARFLVPLGPDFKLALPRAQDVRLACREAWGKPDGSSSVVALRELLAVISAHEWRKKGVPVAAVGGSIHPHYGVFSPVRGEYVNLVVQAPLPPGCELAFDIGTGSGVLAAVLARRGVNVVATDMSPRALACAAENVEKLGLTARVELLEADLFPPGRASLIVCNPPWLPAQPSSPIEYAVYDPDSQMLRGFLTGLCEHLAVDGEGWLILSDLAEHLELRSQDELAGWIRQAGLRVIDRIDTRPSHGKVQDRNDPLHAARAREVTSLWRLAKQ